MYTNKKKEDTTQNNLQHSSNIVLHTDADINGNFHTIYFKDIERLVIAGDSDSANNSKLINKFIPELIKQGVSLFVISDLTDKYSNINIYKFANKSSLFKDLINNFEEIIYYRTDATTIVKENITKVEKGSTDRSPIILIIDSDTFLKNNISRISQLSHLGAKVNMYVLVSTKNNSQLVFTTPLQLMLDRNKCMKDIPTAIYF